MKDFYAKMCFRLYLLLLFLKQVPISSVDEIYFVRCLQIIGLILFVLLVNNKSYKILVPVVARRSVIRIIFLLFIGAVSVSLYQTFYTNFLVVFNVIGFIALGLYMTYWKTKMEFLWMSCILWSYTSIQFLHNVHIKEWFRSSYNHVSVLFLFVTVGLYLHNLKGKSQSLNILPAFIVVLISLISTGRSSIISSVWLLLIVLFFNLRTIKGYVILFAILFAIAIRSDELLNMSSIFLVKFQSQGFSEVGRELVFAFFRKNISLENIIFGFDYSSLLETYDLTVHNSFLSLHSRFGILSLYLIFLPLLLYRRRYGGRIIILLFTSVIYSRAFTDAILISDGFLFGTLFFMLLYTNITQKHGITK